MAKTRAAGKQGINSATTTQPLNRSLRAAKQLYTQHLDIQKEVEAYREYDANTFKNKVVYYNCDDPFESNFFKYFAANPGAPGRGLKRLISTRYDGSPLAGQMTLFNEYSGGENGGDGHRKKPKAIDVMVEHVKHENCTSAVSAPDAQNHKMVGLSCQ